MRNFFERQDEARRNTKKLVALFVLAVVCIIVGIYAVSVALLAWAGRQIDLIRPGLAFIVTVATLGVVGLGSGVKMLSLRRGGHVVAEGLGGEKLDREPENLQERQLLNVVEEMAIASGVPVPPVYVLDEDGINAFAAGFTPDDAVIGVTRGCIELLDRDELQGVIAHEFSHILNEDMRINVRLMGLLHGILLIGITGRLLMRVMFFSGRSRDRDNRGKLAIFFLGLALMIIGFAGFLCGRLIKASVSRQREFLADASAVQFTRNPNGIGGALKKIGGYEHGAKVEANKAEETSHLFFGYALGGGLFSSGSFSTHPPLDERIRRIDPSFEGSYPRISDSASAATEEAGAAGLHGGSPPVGAAEAEEKGATAAPQDVVHRAGTVTPEQVAHGIRMRKDLPEDLRATVHEPIGAVAATYGLLLDEGKSMRERQLDLLRDRESTAVVEETERLYPRVAELARKGRLPLVDVAAPALRDLSDQQQRRFRETVRELVEADDQLSIFEYALETIVRHRLEHVAHPTERRVRFTDMSEIKDDVVTVLSGLAQVGHASARAARRAFQNGLQALGKYELGDVEPVTMKPARLDQALDRLALTAPQLKKDVILACAHCAVADEQVTGAEAELLRAVAVALDVPLPPALSESTSADSSAPKDAESQTTA